MLRATIISLILTTFVSSSCASNTGTGMIAGGVIGAGVGGIAGSGGGALIGGAAGIIAGGLIGAAIDQQDKRVLEKSSPRTVDRINRDEPLTLNDVIKLSQAQVADDKIIEYMQNTQSSYNLSQTQVRRLQNAGVGEKVIQYMVDTSK